MVWLGRWKYPKNFFMQWTLLDPVGWQDILIRINTKYLSDDVLPSPAFDHFGKLLKCDKLKMITDY